MVKIPEELMAKVDDLIIELDKIDGDPETLKREEEFHRLASYLSPEDLLDCFTI